MATSNSAADEMTVTKCPSSLEMSGKADVCSSCPGRSLCLSQGTSQSSADTELVTRMKPIKHKILVMSGKGGVGKSTVAWWLACALRRTGAGGVGAGCQVALLDTDLCGPSVPHLAAVSSRHQPVINTDWGWRPPVAANGVKVMSVGCLLSERDAAVAMRGPRKSQLITSMLKRTLWQKLDYLVIDTPPGTSDEHLSLARLLLQNTTPDGVVLVTTPQSLATGVVRRQVSFCRRVGLTVLGVVINMAEIICPCCNEISELFAGDVTLFTHQLNVPILGRVPFDTRLAVACDRGVDLCDLDSRSAQCLMGVANRLHALCTRTTAEQCS